MKCPVCSNELAEYNTGNFKADICRDGCAGIWLDESELEKCDQFNEKFDSNLLRVKKNADVLIDRNKKRNCPKCTDQVLNRVMLDKDRMFEIDNCPKCHGHWLDIGELERMRSLDKENSELMGRVNSFQKKLEEDYKDPSKRGKVAAFLQLLFK